MLQKLSFLIPVEGFQKTLKRFPLSSACSIALLVIALLFIHEVLDKDDETIGKFAIALGLGYFWFGAFKLYTEARGLSNIIYYAVSVPVFDVLTAWVVYGEDWFSILMLIPVLFLMISYAPYLRLKDNLSVWFYNKQTWYGVALSILAGLLWGGGISASLGSVHVLFDVEINWKVYADLWAIACIVFAPLYALSWIPENFKYTRDDCHAPQQLAFMLNWVLAPLMVIYTLILYAYFVKILGQAEFPRGHLTYMITSYAAIGVVTYLAGWPLKEEGGALFLNLFYKFFFPALIIPLGMMAIAIDMRIDQYGVTISRYYVVLGGFWLLALSVFFTFQQIRKREAPLQIIPALLSILLLISAFGPWDAREVSARDQLSRLKDVLIETRILQNGKIVRAEEGVVTFEQRKVISGTLEYINDVDYAELLKPMLPPKYQDDKRIYASGVMRDVMGLDFVGRYDRRQSEDLNNNRFYYSHNLNKGMEISGYNYLSATEYVYVQNTGENHRFGVFENVPDGFSEIKVHATKDLLKLMINEQPIEFDLAALSRDVLSAPEFDRSQMIDLAQETPDYNVKVIFQNINGKRVNGVVEIENMNIRLLIKDKRQQ